MSKAVKSARGQLVDFDLLKIKQQMASAPKTTNVKAREDFIDRKFKRRIKKLTREVSAVQAVPVEAAVDPKEFDETPEEDK